MLESIISSDEIQRDRTPVMFGEWFDAFLEKTRVDRSNREQILLRQGIAKPVYEEVFPLYRLLNHKRTEWADRKFRNVLGSQPYDAIVTDPSRGSTSFMEITVADVDQAETIRMEEFARVGRVPALAPVSWSGTRRSGRQVQISEDMLLHDDVVAKKKGQLIAAVERKCRHEYRGDTALLIYFDDYTAFGDANGLPVMDDVLRSVREVWRTKFSALYIVGASGRRLWEGQ